MRADRVHTQAAQVVDSRPQADDLADCLSARLELPRQVVIGRALDANRFDHVATRLKRVHRLE